MPARNQAKKKNETTRGRAGRDSTSAAADRRRRDEEDDSSSPRTSDNNGLRRSHERLDHYQERVTGVTRQERELIPYLAQRCYHLPGHSWCDDWLQYFQNNHPIFGICCHHRLHPIRFGIRIWHLVGSIMFGLSMTNVMWLYFFFRGTDHEEAAVTISLSGYGNGEGTEDWANNSTLVEQTAPELKEIEITNGMAFLWTFGGAAHAIFDNTIWYISACVCCLGSQNHKKYKCCGNYCVIFFVVLVTAIATLAVLLRTTIEESYLQASDQEVEETTSYLNVAGVEVPTATETAEDDDDDVALRIQKASAYTFLISYAVELLLAYIVYYPIIGTTFFAGCLGCGKLPVLGGRPYEVAVEEKKKRVEEEKRKRKEEGKSGNRKRSRDTNSSHSRSNDDRV